MALRCTNILKHYVYIYYYLEVVSLQTAEIGVLYSTLQEQRLPFSQEGWSIELTFADQGNNFLSISLYYCRTAMVPQIFSPFSIF